MGAIIMIVGVLEGWPVGGNEGLADWSWVGAMVGGKVSMTPATEEDLMGDPAGLAAAGDKTGEDPPPAADDEEGFFAAMIGDDVVEET